MVLKKKLSEAKGIYLLPNALTTIALCSGFFAIISAINHDFVKSAMAVFVAMIFDFLDGRIARLTGTQSLFGQEFDSLSDLLSFGVAPAVMLYIWQFSRLGRFGWGITFLFVASTAMRLAKFNAQAGEGVKGYFRGMPCPAAAALIASYIWCSVELFNLSNTSLCVFAVIFSVSCSVLMLSNVAYVSLKDVDFKSKFSMLSGLIFILGFVVIILVPPLMLFLVTFSYMLLGPAMLLYKKINGKFIRRLPWRRF